MMSGSRLTNKFESLPNPPKKYTFVVDLADGQIIKGEVEFSNYQLVMSNILTTLARCEGVASLRHGKPVTLPVLSITVKAVIND